MAASLPRAYDVPLLRLRLRLALLTMAILPTTLAMALAYSTLNAQTITDSLRLQERTATAAHVVDAQLERAVTATVLLAANPAFADAQLDPATASKHAAALLNQPFAGIHRLTLVAASGDELLSLAADGSEPRAGGSRSIAPVLRLGRGEVLVGPATSPTGEPVAVISTPVSVANGSASGRALEVELSLAELIATAELTPADGGLYVVERTSGTILVSSRLGDGAEPSGPSAEQVVADLSRQPMGSGHWQVADGWHVAGTPLGHSFGDWQLMLVGRVAPPTLPIALWGLLGALTVLLVAITVWMARQIIGPAQELARSREQLLNMYEAARADALNDALTGLGNHRGFQEELDYQLEWFRRYKVPFALLLIDLDDLKLVNDTDGHSAGDELMRTMGRLIGETTRYVDRAFRIGGDEFAILMPHTTAEAALEIGRRLLDRAMQAPGRPIRFSAGISACPALATTRDQLYAQADAALYWCKRHGRATVDVYDPVRDQSADQTVSGSQSAQIATIVAQGLLRAVYQPVVDLRSGAVIGFEGLTRPLPESGFSNPGDLFAAADAVGRTVELDYACLETVVSQAHGLGDGQLLSVNLSPRTIEAPQFSAEWLVSVLSRHSMDPRRVVIELTEQQDIEDLPQVQRNLASLQRAGIRVAVDDVGAGNAGLRLLSQFRFDIVKIDLSLVQDGTRRDSSRAVLTSLRELAGRWGAYVVAEGLETVSQLRVVRELRLSAGQGYLLGRPMPAPTLARVDLVSLEAGGVVMQARQRDGGELPLPAPRPATN